jgi:hypothetical protein
VESTANGPIKMDQSYLIRLTKFTRLGGKTGWRRSAVWLGRFRDCTPNTFSTDVSNPKSDENDCGLQV